MNADAIHATILTLFMEKSIIDTARVLYMRPSSVYWRVRRAEKLLGGQPLVVVRDGRRRNGFLNRGVTLDGKGRLYETQAQMTAVQVIPDDTPDWGGLNMEPLDLDISIPIAWVLTLLAAAMSLSLLVWWLRTYR